MRIQEGITPTCPDVISVLNVCQPFDGTNLKSMDFSRERLRRVLRKKTAVVIHLHTLTPAIFTPSRLLIYIFTPSRLQIYIFTPSHLQI